MKPEVPARVTAISPLSALQGTSLADTVIPGALETDANGMLVIDGDSKAIMDYFLSLTGEMPTEDIRQMLLAWASHSAGPEAGEQFIALFDKYLQYIKAAADGNFSADGANAIRRNLQLRQQLRDDVFGQATAAVLFADENAYDLFSAERMEIMQSTLTEADKADAIQALHQSLPPHLAAQYQQQHQLQRLAQQEQALRDQGGDDADVYALRQQQFGDQAAMRLQALDEQRRQWQQRVERYRHARAAILSASLAAPDQQQQIDALREQMFSDSEQLRVAALDRMQQPQD